MGVYAAKSYLDRIGRPETLEDAARLDFVGFDRSDLIIRVMTDLGLEATRDFFAVRCDQQAVHWELVRAGCGLGGAQTIIGDADPTMERILEGQIQLQAPPIWLTAPQALHSNARIRAIWDYLSEGLAQQIGA